jgi:hypothetical protein
MPASGHFDWDEANSAMSASRAECGSVWAFASAAIGLCRLAKRPAFGIFEFELLSGKMVGVQSVDTWRCDQR